jgi:hypothetical protein
MSPGKPCWRLADCDLKTASRISKQLKNEGYLVANAGSKKRGFGQTGKPKFVAEKSVEIHSRLMDQYFNPTTKIAYHVSFDVVNQKAFLMTVWLVRVAE